jgi:hypothetical protein
MGGPRKLSDKTLAMCGEFTAGGTVADIAREFGVKPATVRAALCRGKLHVPEPMAEEAKALKRMKRVQHEDPVAVDRPRVSRDPCRLCGIRGDLGCKHAPLQEMHPRTECTPAATAGAGA